jgi:hypothetical protein
LIWGIINFIPNQGLTSNPTCNRAQKCRLYKTLILDKSDARIELEGDLDPYEEVLKSIESLPEPDAPLRTVARDYKKILYGTENEHTQGI